MYEPLIRLSVHVSSDRPSFVNWLLWIQQDGEGNRGDRLWAGRVKLQDDPIATAEAVLYEAREQLQTALATTSTPPLF